MTITELAEQLETAGYPVAFNVFPKDEPHEPPFVCYIVIQNEQFYADGVVYATKPTVQVELYTIEKDLDAEERLQTALHEFTYTKNEGYLEDEKMYMVTYQFTL